MGIVSAIPEKCKRCYACVRECPARAIKVEQGQALVLEERCIACGNCVKVCTQNAKRILDNTQEVWQLLADGNPVFACLAPSFPAAFHEDAPGSVIAAVRRLGFAEVWNVGFGAELVAREYTRLYGDVKHAAGRVIATPCPALVAYVEKYLPSLRASLAPIVSPMIAAARAIRHRHGPDVRVVFIGPCIAKKNEIRDPFVANAVDSVLTFKELSMMFDAKSIDPGALAPEEFDSPPCLVGGAFPISGGLLRTAEVTPDILDNDIVVAEGKDRALVALTDAAEGSSQARFLDLLFCEGCISGPKMLNELGLYARKELLARYVNEQRQRVQREDYLRGMEEFRALELGRSFTAQDLELPQPTEEEIMVALLDMHKFEQEDHLDCGACGYPTCRAKAIAVCQGLAEPSMCLPYMIDELEDACEQLQAYHRDLEAAQQRLVQSERLASMGQLSAGVAHELNNPLGTVLIYSHMLLRHMKEGDASRADIEMIVGEATRCKNIVRGLLDFARQSRVTKSEADLAQIIREVAAIMAKRAEDNNVRLAMDIEPLPRMMIDGNQIKQMLINLVGNAVDAIHREDGQVTLRARRPADNGRVIIEVSDNGKGIPQENLSKLFTPFFTTKELGKGTGLGLAICYGIVKMHSGDITVQSEEGVGTTFTVSLPAGDVGQA